MVHEQDALRVASPAPTCAREGELTRTGQRLTRHASLAHVPSRLETPRRHDTPPRPRLARWSAPARAPPALASARDSPATRAARHLTTAMAPTKAILLAAALLALCATAARGQPPAREGDWITGRATFFGAPDELRKVRSAASARASCIVRSAARAPCVCAAAAAMRAAAHARLARTALTRQRIEAAVAALLTVCCAVASHAPPRALSPAWAPHPRAAHPEAALRHALHRRLRVHQHVAQRAGAMCRVLMRGGRRCSADTATRAARRTRAARARAGMRGITHASAPD
jgi:hypothetical protein